MSGTQAWGFTDDRGTELGAARVPRRVIAYVRAGAALCDLGVTPVAVYGSGHDGDVLDPAKEGGLTAAAVTYLGPGRVLDEGLLRELRPDVIVDVTYDGKSPYALDEAVAERLGVPLVALSVGNELTLPAILDRFGALAVSLGAAAVDGTTAEGSPAGLRAAEDELREAAARTGLGVLALSGAGPDQVHLARPLAWPELARLAELGVRLVDPGPGPGANWLTGDWGRAAELRPDLVLFDSRAHATAPDEALSGVRFTPWNPETPPSPAAYARFFRALAGALAD
ncbi:MULTISPECIES: ABC transporter substrate-binding protein [unclassified Streptomyces]|uniref:ABC transporter substrate-binding protein n=1 Tax=unclassified Streptomyces TaxID=2593676 RepID=UPI001E630650|nr:ABC transporter substrate-binding protein [Streptomyces sp. CB02980]MCB8907761.1 ABC transporter substrate-binding protein [Streptomyces sp. CB02980]